MVPVPFPGTWKVRPPLGLSTTPRCLDISESRMTPFKANDKRQSQVENVSKQKMKCCRVVHGVTRCYTVLHDVTRC